MSLGKVFIPAKNKTSDESLERILLERDSLDVPSIFESSLKNMTFDSKSPLIKGKKCDSDPILIFEDEEKLSSKSLSLIIGLPVIVIKMR